MCPVESYCLVFKFYVWQLRWRASYVDQVRSVPAFGRRGSLRRVPLLHLQRRNWTPRSWFGDNFMRKFKENRFMGRVSVTPCSPGAVTPVVGGQ